jgi:hypothetical protein
MDIEIVRQDLRANILEKGLALVLTLLAMPLDPVSKHLMHKDTTSAPPQQHWTRIGFTPRSLLELDEGMFDLLNPSAEFV